MDVWIVRSIVSAANIIILAIEHGLFTIQIVSDIIMVVVGVLGWVYCKSERIEI